MLSEVLLDLLEHRPVSYLSVGDVENYWAHVKKKHISWKENNRRVFGRGGARTTRGVNNKRSAVEGYNAGTKTTTAVATKKVKRKERRPTTYRIPRKTDVQPCITLDVQATCVTALNVKKHVCSPELRFFILSSFQQNQCGTA